MKRCWDAIPFQNGCDVPTGPVTRPVLPPKAQKRLRWPLALTRGGMIVERLWQAAWPLATVALAAIALAGFGGMQGWVSIILMGLAALICLVLAARRFIWPTADQTVRRLDNSLKGHPIATLRDEQATGVDDAASARLWQAHQSRMLGQIENVQAISPDLRVAAKDPLALRLIAATGAGMAIIFGPWTSAPTSGAETTATISASWEGWIEPPSYTGKPSLYLDDQSDGTLHIPTGSRLTLRRYGDPLALAFQGTALDTAASAVTSLTQQITRDGTLIIDGPVPRRWSLTAMPDSPPEIRPVGPLTRQLSGDFTLNFEAEDDYGITGGEVIISLALDEVTRDHGLSIDPEPRTGVSVDLPLPYRGLRTQIDGTLQENLIEHPFAGLPVTLTFQAHDGADQTGESQPYAMILPTRRFLNPVAKALIEQRRDLLWNRANARRASQVLRATLTYPEDLHLPEGLYLQLRSVIRRLEAGIAFTDVAQGVPNDLRDEVAQVLWDVAVQLDDGQLGDARARMEEALKRLEQAMRDGASAEELAELMEDYRDAMRDYVNQLAQQAPDQDPNAPQPDNAIELSQADLDAMMDRIEELMREGRADEAMQLLQQMQEMMENMQVAQGGEGQGQGDGAREDLRETMRQQQGLSDQAFRDLQEQGQGSQAGENQDNEGRDGGQGRGQSHDGAGGEQGQNGDGGGQEGPESQGGGDPGNSLADQQRALQQQLDSQRRSLPGAGDPAGRAARNTLDKAGRAMGRAADALEQGDIPEALDQQADAMEALREGLRQFDQAMANQQAEQDGQQGGNPGESDSASSQDPLGRSPTGQGGANQTDNPLGDTEETYRRAQELMQELRKRSGDTDRPELERDYLKRLLDRF
ncbi:TIGR02302 family protein [Aliiroseovarius halocynthiae]|nr:TIGR02302 family protein [Aliiroseovarius halocynthiae]